MESSIRMRVRSNRHTCGGKYSVGGGEREHADKEQVRVDRVLRGSRLAMRCCAAGYAVVALQGEANDVSEELPPFVYSRR